MKLLNFAIYAAVPLLSACAGFLGIEKPPALVTHCDDFSKLGHAYYQAHNKEGFKAISSGTLQYFPQEGLISRLDMSGDLEGGPQAQRRFSLGATEAGPGLKVDQRASDYVAILIPPETAAKHLAQQLDKPLPAFVMVPAEAFYQGVCRQGAAPFFVGSSQSLSETPIPQLTIGEPELKALVSALYLDPRSNSLEELRRHYRDKWFDSQKFVNPDKWGGWSDITVRTRHRGAWRKLWNFLSGSSLGEAGTVDGTSLNIGAAYSTPPLLAITAENSDIESRWRKRLADYATRHGEIDAKVKAVQSLLASPSVNGAAFNAAAQQALAAIEEQRKTLDSSQVSLGYEQDLFVTDIEIAFVVGEFRDKLEQLFGTYRELAERYAAAVAIKPGHAINAGLILNPIPVIVDGVTQQPVKLAPVVISMEKFGGSLTAHIVAFLEPVKQPDDRVLYRVRANGLVNLTSSLRDMQGQLEQKIRAEERCSVRIRSINFNIPDAIVAGRYAKDVEVGLTARTCATITYYRPCGKWYKPSICKERVTMKTDLYDTTARGRLSATVNQIGDDFTLSYAYSLCAHSFFCVNDAGTTPQLMEKLKSDKKVADYLGSVGGRVESLQLSPDLNGDSYLAIQAATKPLDSTTAIAVLIALSSREQ